MERCNTVRAFTAIMRKLPELAEYEESNSCCMGISLHQRFSRRKQL